MHHSKFSLHSPQSVDIFAGSRLVQASAVAASEPSAWPNPRSGHRLLAGRHDLWLVGGFHPAENDVGGLLFEEVWQFNIASGQWRRLQTKGVMPVELASHAALLDPPYLLVHGGTATPFGIRRSRRLHRLCLRTLEWSEIALTHVDRRSKPKKVYGHSFTLVTRPDGSRQIYQFGGTTGHEYSNTMHRLSTDTWQWQLAEAQPAVASRPGSEPPTPRYRHEAVFWRDRLYIVGGGTAVTVCRLDKLPVFSPETGAWSWMQTRGPGSDSNAAGAVPQARRCHACLLHGDWLMLSGGCTEDNIPLADVWFLHMPSGVWSRSRHSLPRPTYFHAAAATPDGRAFIFGGVVAGAQGHGSRSSALYSCWLPGNPSRLDRLCLRVAVPRLVAWLRKRGLTAHRGSLRMKLMQLGVPPDLLMECLAGFCPLPAGPGAGEDGLHPVLQHGPSPPA